MTFHRPLLLATCASLLAFGSTARAADEIRMIMNWTADSAHLGFAMAQAKGLYAARDLDVTLEEGRGSSVAAQMVATGSAELGYADAGAAFNAASKGAPVRIVSTIWKSGQFGIQSLASSGIKSPADLAGKRIAVAPGTAMVPLVPVFLRANDIDESDVEIVSVAQSAVLGLLTKGEIDAIAETPENVVVPLAEQGIEAGNLYFYEHGVPLVSLSLVARADAIEEHGERYARFIEATLEGWREAMLDPEAAVAALLEQFPDTENSSEALLQGARYSFASVCPGGSGDAIGVTDESTWETVYEVMTSAMGLPETQPVTHYFTNELLPEQPVLCP